MSSVVYLDFNATTPVLKETISELVSVMAEDFGNPASKTHRFGWKAAERVENSRSNMAKLLNCEPGELYFNSGSTEGLNTLIKGFFKAYHSKGRHIISCKTEHKAVLDSLEYIKNEGAEISWLGVDRNGQISLNELKSLLRPETIAVCLMLANNETGIIHDMKTIASIVHEAGALLVCDATQAVGKIAIDIYSLGIDAMVFSGHKFYAMKGVGGVFVKRKNPRVRCLPMLHGGGHENGFRSGSLNVAGIVSMELSLQKNLENLESESQRQIELRQKLESGIKMMGGLVIGENMLRLPNTTMVLLPGIKAEKLITQLPFFAFSTGSACSSAQNTPSHVLLAMGYTEEEAYSAIRISIGRFTLEEDVLSFVTELRKSYKTIGNQ